MQSDFILVLLAGVLLLQVFLVWRMLAGQGANNLAQDIQQLHLALQASSERIERELRAQMQQTAQEARHDSTANFSQFQQAFFTQLENMRMLIQSQATEGRQEQALSLQRFADTMQQSLLQLTESNEKRMIEVRTVLENKMRDLQTDNGNKLEEIRKTVDEKLQTTLERRLGESFKLVSERLEKVHQGLGEMQNLAVGVGDLKRVLNNVKSRGTWGEVQLEMLLSDLLTVDQYAKNVETIPGTGARVEFAIKLPGSSDTGAPMWMPIDAKFPKEQYERLIDAAERGDADGVANATRELERAILKEAKTIAQKYISPPLTTDFAILFLPTEGLYAEVMRCPGLADELQRSCRVTIAGPSTLLAILSSLQMGFRTLALEKRSSEVWQVLGAVKTEFTKFGDVLAATKQSLERAAKNIEGAETRTRQMNKKLRDVEALSDDQAGLVIDASLD